MLLANEVFYKLNPPKSGNKKMLYALSLGFLIFSVIIACSILTGLDDQITPTSETGFKPASTKSLDATTRLPTTSSASSTTDEDLITPVVSPGGSNTDLENLGTFNLGSEVEISIPGPTAKGLEPGANPFEIQVDVTFTSPNGKSYIVPAFYDGDGIGGMDGNIWKVRFAPDITGSWSFNVADPIVQFNRYEGGFQVLPFSGCDNNDGPPLDLNCYGRLEYVGGQYLRFQNGVYWIKGGVDDPENFLGDAFGDWQAKREAIDYLSSKGVNSIYVITNNIDGDRNDTWPWVGDTPQEAKANSDRFNIAKLQQWEDFFSYVQSKGIVLHIVLNDDSAWDGYNKDLYIREMIARFGHHPGIIWNVGEEANEIFSNEEQIALAADIQRRDPFNHPVTVHRKTPWPFIGNLSFDLTSIQIGDGSRDFSSANVENYNDIVITHRERSVEQCHTIPVMIDETPRITSVNEQTRTKLRTQVLYPIFFGGGNFEMHYRDAYGQDGALTIQDLEPMMDDMKRARQFVESLPFPEMEPCNELLTGQSNYCFGKDGNVYAIYLPAGRELAVDLTKSVGSYNIAWFNPRTGELSKAGSVAGGGVRTFNPPDNSDWVLQLDNPESQIRNGYASGEVEYVNLTDSMFSFSLYLPIVTQCGG